MISTIQSTFASTLFTNLYPQSTIHISLHVLSQDGSLLAALLNAATLALIDAGIPMRDYVTASTAGSTSSYSSNDETADPLLDLNGSEEQELPFLTVATLGKEDQVSVLVMETRVQVGRLEGHPCFVEGKSTASAAPPRTRPPTEAAPPRPAHADRLVQVSIFSGPPFFTGEVK